MMGFAVVDFETTGILPAMNHRVVEIGVTHVEADGTVSGHWETLVNPERDLGPQRIHGIAAAQAMRAPLFKDIAPDFADLLRGRVFVAHNAVFDLRFLAAEFERAGHPLSEDIPHVCTMRLGAQFGLGGSVALAHACEYFGITNIRAHSAGADARATAQLLSAYLSTTAEAPAWRQYWSTYLMSAGDYPYPQNQSNGVVWKSRDELASEDVHFLERISNETRRPGATGADAEYLALLDRCLLDRDISVRESHQLASVAEEIGLTRSEAETLHADYYSALCQVAWADGVLTREEQSDLETVAVLLRIPVEMQALLKEQAKPSSDGFVTKSHLSQGNFSAFALAAGDLIVLTGEMSRPRSAWEDQIRGHGFTPHGAITKKVRLLVAADPDSLSGKAKKARDYGIPIVNEDGLARLLQSVSV